MTTITADVGAEEQRGLVALSHAIPAGGWASALLPAALPPSTVPGPKQGEYQSIIIQAARKMQLTGWGKHGSVIGFQEVVPLFRLWIPPGYPIEYTEEDIATLGMAMLRDGQREPLVVVEAKDTRPETVEGGGTGGDLMIVEGVRRFLAAPRAGLDAMGVIVQPYGDFYSAVADSVARKVAQSQHPLSDVELGLLIVWMRIAHNLTRAQQPDLPKFPTQVELAAMLGRSQGTISKWCRIARMPDSVLESLINRTLTSAQAAEMLALPPEEQEQLAAQVAADNVQAVARGAHPVPRSQVREMAKGGGGGGRGRQQQQQQQAHWSIPVYPVPSGLWIEDVQDWQLPVAVAALAHDLALCLEAAASNMNRTPHPAFAALRKALAAPEVRRHIKSVRQG